MNIEIMKQGRFFCRLVCVTALFQVVSGGGFAVELGERHREQFQLCRDLSESGEWEKAREVARDLVNEFQDEGPSRHRLAFTNELANLNQRLGDYSEAARGYEICLNLAEILEESLDGKKSLTVAQLKNNLSALKQIMGDFEEAEALSREALTLRESIDGKASLATVPSMNNLAGLLWCIGDLEAAETLYRGGLEIRMEQMGPNHTDTARSRANLGGLLYYSNELTEAGPLVRDAASAFEKNLGSAHPETLEVLLFLGEIERASGSPERARDLYQRVLDGRLEIFGGKPHVETAEALRRVGDAERELGSYDLALKFYRQSDEAYRAVIHEDHPDRLEGLYGAGLAAFASGDSDLALERARRLSQLEFENFRAVLAFADERQRLAFQNLFRSQNLYASLGKADEVAEFLLRRKGVVVDSLIAEARFVKRARSAGIEGELERLTDARARFRSVFLSGGAEGDGMAEAEAEVKNIQRAIREKLQLSYADIDPFDLQLVDLQASLEEDAVLVDFLEFDQYRGKGQFEKCYGAAVVSRDSVAFVNCCSAAPLNELLASLMPFSSGLGQMEDAEAGEALRTIHRDLIEPLHSRLVGKKRIYLCPDGPLNFVPFSCLVGPEGRFLIEDFDMGYVSAARELMRNRKGSASGNTSVLVGDPGFSSENEVPVSSSGGRGLLAALGASTLSLVADSLTPLEGAREEVRQIGEVFRGNGINAEILVGGEATEPKLRELVRKPHILHLATHGIYLPDHQPDPEELRLDSSFVPGEVAGFQNPLFGSWIALSGAQSTVEAWSRGDVPDPERDGILMANEAADLDLENTLLVTLSACDTASGEATSGDGVLGIRRGFRKAGAENVLTTLWPINDAMTVTMMKEFYEGLASEPPAVALSSTQRKWLVKIRDNPEAVALPSSDGGEIRVGGLAWAVYLAGPFLLSR